MTPTDSDPQRRLIECVRLVIPVSGLVFAFLIVMPFNARFVSVTAVDQKAYSVAFICAGLATVLLVAVGVQPMVHIARTGDPGATQRTTRTAVASPTTRNGSSGMPLPLTGCHPPQRSRSVDSQISGLPLLRVAPPPRKRSRRSNPNPRIWSGPTRGSLGSPESSPWS